jgi:hypothetical protein
MHTPHPAILDRGVAKTQTWLNGRAGEYGSDEQTHAYWLLEKLSSAMGGAMDDIARHDHMGAHGRPHHPDGRSHDPGTPPS